MQEKVLIVSEKTVKQYLSVEDIIDRVEQTWRWYGEGKINMPSKITLDMSSMGVAGWINSMPSYIQPEDIAGIKWVGGFADNHKAGLPYIKAKIMLTDPHTGLMKALISGDWISDIRTGAQTAVFAKYLAVKVDVVTIIGAGLQGYTTLLCLSKFFRLKEVRVCDINLDACAAFIERFRTVLDCPMIATTDNQKACAGSDLIVTATTANKPLVQREWVKTGALVSTIGSYQELSDDLIFAADKIIVDHIDQHMHRGEFLNLIQAGRFTRDHFSAEFPKILTGEQTGRSNNQELIIISLIGMGCLDTSVAALLYSRIIHSGKDDKTIPVVDLA
ncbi:MAG: ornithine cyclodeaminase family protein [Clostridiaceae bacterium]|nr:ornithine cyclodeaminase family protein [Clostridiaceae bacterium]